MSPRRHSRRDCRSPPYPETAKVAARNACGETKAGASRLTAFALLLANLATVVVVGRRWLRRPHPLDLLSATAGRMRLVPGLRSIRVSGRSQDETSYSPVARPDRAVRGRAGATDRIGALVSRASRAALTSDLARRAPRLAGLPGNSGARPGLRGRRVRRRGPRPANSVVEFAASPAATSAPALSTLSANSALLRR